jgi:predicted esterase
MRRFLLNLSFLALILSAELAIANTPRIVCDGDPLSFSKDDANTRQQLGERYFPWHFEGAGNQPKQLHAIQRAMTCKYFGPKALARLRKAQRSNGYTAAREWLIGNYLIDLEQARTEEFRLYQQHFPEIGKALADGIFLKQCAPSALYFEVKSGKSVWDGAALTCTDGHPIVTVNADDDSKWIADFELNGEKANIRLANPKLRAFASGDISMRLDTPQPLFIHSAHPKYSVSVQTTTLDISAPLAIDVRNIETNVLVDLIQANTSLSILGKQHLGDERASYQFSNIPSLVIMQLIADVSGTISESLQPTQFRFRDTAPPVGDYEPVICFNRTCLAYFPGTKVSTTRANSVGIVSNHNEKTILFQHSFWPNVNKEAYLDSMLGKERQLLEWGYRPIWFAMSPKSNFISELGCKYNAAALMPVGSFFNYFAICAESEADLNILKHGLRPLTQETLPKNPFLGQQTFPNIDAVASEPIVPLLERGEYKKALAAIKTLRETRSLNPESVVEIMAHAGYSAEALAFAGEELQAGNLSILGAFSPSGFKSFRNSPEYKKLDSYAVQVNAFWSQLAHTQMHYDVGKKVDFKKPVPLIFALHGYGSEPTDFARQGKELADSLGAIVVRVSATHRRPLGGYSWDELAEVDALHLQYAEDLLSSKLSELKIGRRLMFGFSQGGQMSLEIAAKYPERFAGAAAFSPGTLGELELNWLGPGETLKDRHFLIHVNAENPLNVKWAKADRRRLNAAGAEVTFSENTKITAHTVPPNFNRLLANWARQALDR